MKSAKKRPNSLWQNSLSRMSNKFTIFGGGNSQSSTLMKSHRQLPADQSHHDDHQDEQQQQQQVALDAWIEAKVVSYWLRTTFALTAA